jgi:arginase family enzyme
MDTGFRRGPTYRYDVLCASLTGINIVGMDVMEVAPCYDSAEITSLAAATIAYDLLHVVAANRDPSLPRP